MDINVDWDINERSRERLMFLRDHIVGDSRTRIQDQLNGWLGHAVGAGVLPTPQSHPVLAENFADGEFVTEPEPKSQYDFGETFTIYFLDPETVQSAASRNKDLSQLAQPADRRYHQLRHDGQPVAYAHSIISRGDEICQLMVSNYPQSVQHAMERLDEIEKYDEKYAQAKINVRMLSVPAFNVNAFWIFDESIGESEVLVISAPANMASLATNDLINGSAFLEALANETPVRGLA